MYNFINIFLIVIVIVFFLKCNVVNVIMLINKMLLVKLFGFVVIVDLKSFDIKRYIF